MKDKFPATDKAVAAGAAIYSKPFLLVYDLIVLGFSNTFVWQCPSGLILDFYNKHVSGKHLDVGVGTGYFLDKCKFPMRNPTIALVDLNINSLQVAARRLRHTGQQHMWQMCWSRCRLNQRTLTLSPSTTCFTVFLVISPAKELCLEI